MQLSPPPSPSTQAQALFKQLLQYLYDEKKADAMAILLVLIEQPKLLEKIAQLTDPVHKMTLLLWLARGYGHPIFAQHLIAANADLTARDLDKRTAMHLAAIEGNVWMIKLLLDAGVSVDVLDQQQFTPLMYACIGSHQSSLQAILSNTRTINAVNAVNAQGYSALDYGIRRQNINTIILLLRAYGISKLSPTPAQAETIKKILNAHSDCHRTPLHYAALQGKVTTAKILIKHGALVDARDDAGCTPLMYACSKGHTDIIRLLVPITQALQATNNNNLNALDFALQSQTALAIWTVISAYLVRKVEPSPAQMERFSHPDIQSLLQSFVAQQAGTVCHPKPKA